MEVSLRLARIVFFMVVALAAACSGKSLRSSRPEPAPPPGSLPPLPRSSIAAVLEHREELRLTPDQVQRLEGYDEKLAPRNPALREGAGAAYRPPRAGGGPPARGRASAAPGGRLDEDGGTRGGGGEKGRKGKARRAPPRRVVRGALAGGARAAHGRQRHPRLPRRRGG